MYRITCDKEASSDLSQDTFVKVIEKQGQFRGDSDIKTWVFTIGSNLAMDWLRKKKRWQEIAQDEAKQLAESDAAYPRRFRHVQQTSSSGQFDFREHINFCFSCLAKTLPIEQQLALILKDIYDFKVKDICRILGAPVGTVKHWLLVSRKTMNDIFEKRCALINKNGPCYQCSELNGFFNPDHPVALVLSTEKEDREEMYRARTTLIKAIDPLSAGGAALEDEIMQVLRKAIGDEDSVRDSDRDSVRN